MEFDLNGLNKELKRLQEIEVKYSNIQKFFEAKSSEIYSAIDKIEENNRQLILGVKEKLAQINPSVSILGKKTAQSSGRLQRAGIVSEVVSWCVQFLRENKTEELTIPFLTKKFDIHGATSTKVKQMLMEHPEIKKTQHPVKRKQVIFSYKSLVNLPEGMKLSEKINHEKLGDLVPVGEDTQMPRKTSYMG